jgi:hypothetical protein
MAFLNAALEAAINYITGLSNQADYKSNLKTKQDIYAVYSTFGLDALMHSVSWA